MPEGDTIHNVAARLRPALAGRSLVRLDLRGPGRRPPSRPRAGTLVTGVDAVGKHLVVGFADGHVLRTHLRMTGRWDLYGPGERWRRPGHLARAVVEVDGAVAVCFAAPVVELTRERRPGGPPGDGDGDGAPPAALAHLGPDLCRDDADLDAVVARMGALEPGTDVAEVLLDQRVAAGIGNVYKSEVCWACRVHPLTPLGSLDGGARRDLVETAARLLRRNLTGTSPAARAGRRTTVEGAGPGALAVYGRARRPCPRCGTPVAWRRTGPHRRTTYWCPRCQPEPAGTGGGGGAAVG